MTHSEGGNQSTKVNTEFIEMLELADKDTRTFIITYSVCSES